MIKFQSLIPLKRSAIVPATVKKLKELGHRWSKKVLGLKSDFKNSDYEAEVLN